MFEDVKEGILLSDSFSYGGPLVENSEVGVGKLSREPQSTQTDSKSSPSGSPKMFSRLPDRDFAQNFGADPARGV